MRCTRGRRRRIKLVVDPGAVTCERLIEGVLKLPNLVQVLERTSEHVRVQIYGGLDVQLVIVPREAWGSGLVWYTGAQAHGTVMTR